MPADKFLEELRSHYEKEFDIRENQDTKASDTIRIAWTISVFFLAFANFLLVQFCPSNSCSKRQNRSTVSLVLQLRTLLRRQSLGIPYYMTCNSLSFSFLYFLVFDKRQSVLYRR
jgi:hypothetical protein